MAKGVMVVLLCPMMDEQLFYSLQHEDEPYRLVLLTNKYSDKTAQRLTERGISFETCPERTFCNGLLETDPEEFTIIIRVNSLGLHSEPKDLRAYVEKEIVEMQDKMDVLALYYGLCGNATWDVVGWCRDNGYKPATILRNEGDGRVVDDCVGVWIGNDHTYYDLVKKYTGILLVTPSIADNWAEFMLAGESADAFRNMTDDMKEMLGVSDLDSYLKWMFEACGYQNVLKIPTGYELDPARFEEEFQDIARRVNLKPILIEDGWVTIQPADIVYKGAKALLGDD